MAPDAIRVMLVDDHELIRKGLRSYLEGHANVTVVAEAENVRQAVARANAHTPDVIVMDVQMPDGTGIEACRTIRSQLPATKVIMLTSFADDDAVMQSVIAGASAFLLKTTPGAEIAAAIETVASGQSMLDPKITERLLAQVRTMASAPPADSKPKLTENEQKILERIAEGKTNREIAAEVYLSEKTVKKYVSNILDKLDLRRRAEAAAYFVRGSARP